MFTLNVYVITRKYITLLSKWLCQIAKCLNWGHHVMSTSVDAPQKKPKRAQRKVHMELWSPFRIPTGGTAKLWRRIVCSKLCKVTISFTQLDLCKQHRRHGGGDLAHLPAVLLPKCCPTRLWPEVQANTSRGSCWFSNGQRSSLADDGSDPSLPGARLLW